MINIFRKTNISLFLAVLAAVAMAGGYALLYFAVKKKASVAEEISLRVEDTEDKQGRLSSSIAAIKERAADIETLESAFVRESAIASFAQKIEALGPRSGVILKMESLDQSTEKKGSNPKLIFRLKATGNFEQVAYFLVLLEAFPARIEWREARMSRSTDTEPLAGEKSKPGPPLWGIDVAANVLNFTNE